MASGGLMPPLDLADIERRLRSGRRSPLARACGAAPGARVHDAMAGWGTDGFVLAALGCRVHMSERNSEVYAALAARAAAFSSSALAARTEAAPTWALEDARGKWRAGAAFDAVYLDPMFGEHPKTALPAKPMQALAALAEPTAAEDVAALVEQARQVAGRVVVKRRASAPPALRPDWRIKARSVRFDVYRGYGAGRSRS